MIDSSMRSLYQKLIINPLLKLKWLQKLHPNFLTLLATLTGLCIPLLLLNHHAYAAFLALTLSGFFDTLDGSMARFKNKATPQGAAFDITSDRLVEFAILLGFYLFMPNERGLAVICMLGSILLCITTFLVVGIFTENGSEKSFHYSSGLIERGEAFFFFGMMILIPELFIYLAYVFTCLVLITALVRLAQFRSAGIKQTRAIGDNSKSDITAP